ncbi:MAG: hypothetical protein FD180_4127, partial [Planctomycetota bacterium]
RPAEGPRTALFLGRLVPNKGLADLVEAWAALRPRGWRVRVAGPDDAGHMVEIRAQAARSGVERDFEFTGTLEEDAKWRALEEADLFVLPTRGENFGMSIAEALAAGVPVITTRGAPWPGIAERRCGWWIDHGPGPLEVALREAVGLTAVERAEMGRRGRTLAQEQFGWSAVAENLVRLYAWAAGRGVLPEFVREAKP